MQGINSVVLVGRLSADPVLRKTATNKSVASFSVAIDRRSSQGEENAVDFINCVVWNAVADNVAKYLHKGSLVGLKGRLQSRKYQDKQGNNRVAFEVVCDTVQFLESKSSNAGAVSSQPVVDDVVTSETVMPSEEDFADLDGLDVSTDDLPF